MRAVAATDAAAVGEQTVKHGFELRGLDLPIEAQLLRALAEPFARAIGIGPRVVIVGGKVVGGPAGRADIGYREHDPAPRRAGPGFMIRAPGRRGRVPRAAVD